MYKTFICKNTRERYDFYRFIENSCNTRGPKEPFSKQEAAGWGFGCESSTADIPLTVKGFGV